MVLANGVVSCVYHDHDYHVCVGFIACFMIRRRMMMMLRDKYERRQSVKKERIRRGIYKRFCVDLMRRNVTQYHG
jgi:hypothetical protein